MSEAVLDRLRRGPATIAYLGTSVTVQRSGFRPRLHELLEEASGHRHRSVLAGVGGADSLAGAFLMDLLVIPHRPDVCVVEFATTDACSPLGEDELDAALEVVAASLLAGGCAPLLLALPREDAPRSPRARGRVAAVAARHGLACVDAEPTPGLLRDGLHLTPGGAQLVAERALAASRTAPAPARGRVPPPWRPLLVRPQPDWYADPSRVEQGRLNLVEPYLRSGPGNPLTVPVDGELAGLVVVAGPTSGWVVAGDQPILLWDTDCTYQRLAAPVLPARAALGTATRIEPVERDVPGRPPGPIDLRLVAIMVRR